MSKCATLLPPLTVPGDRRVAKKNQNSPTRQRQIFSSTPTRPPGKRSLSAKISVREIAPRLRSGPGRSRSRSRRFAFPPARGHKKKGGNVGGSYKKNKFRVNTFYKNKNDSADEEFFSLHVSKKSDRPTQPSKKKYLPISKSDVIQRNPPTFRSRPTALQYHCPRCAIQQPSSR